MLKNILDLKLTRSADKHIFRLDDEAGTPMMREDMNFELARLAAAAGMEHEVTSGMFRRLVAHKVFEQREFDSGTPNTGSQTVLRSQAPFSTITS